MTDGDSARRITEPDEEDLEDEACSCYRLWLGCVRGNRASVVGVIAMGRRWGSVGARAIRGIDEHTSPVLAAEAARELLQYIERRMLAAPHHKDEQDESEKREARRDGY